MKKPNRTGCRQDELKQFLRFELPYSELPAEMKAESEKRRNVRGGKITFDEFLSALRNMSERKTTVCECRKDWLVPLLEMGDEVGLPELFGYAGHTMDEIDLREGIYAIPFQRGPAVYFVTALLMYDYGVIRKDGTDVLNADLMIEILENVVHNEHLPMHDWKLNTVQKMSYILDRFHRETIDLQDREHKDLFRRCLDDLCEEGIYEALSCKAYCCYGGNSIYECDWELTERYLKILVDETEDALSANTLGDIYYYGYTNNGVPQYEKAFRYYSIGALSGVYESMYRCADMLLAGQGVPRNRLAAWNQISFVYAHTKTDFTEGVYGVGFADAAVRMGDCLRDGIGTEPDPMLAYSYYLDAQTAINMRMRYDKLWGDDDLYRRITDSVSRMEEKLGNHVHNLCHAMKQPALIDRMLSGGFPLKMKVQKYGKSTDLIFTRIEDDPKKLILFTIESMSYSALKDHVVLHCSGYHSRTIHDCEEIVFTHVRYDRQTQETVFLTEDGETGRIKVDEYRFEDDRPADWENEKICTFAAVIFPDGVKEYDYINDIPGLKRGDRVMVDDSEYSEAWVLRTFQARLSEMPLEPGRYKHIRQKITAQMLS